jgi:mono/diheme cytochrome c family protein
MHVVRVMVVVALLGSVGAACGGADRAAPELTAEQREDPALVAGEQVFANNCATCHGADGRGRSNAPSLEDIEDRYSLEDQVVLITGGRGGMPPFSSRLSDEEIEAVARYEREVL